MDIEHISVSRSKTYRQCRQLYKYKYHLRIPNPGEEPEYFVYGKIVHKIAETYVIERGKRSLAAISTDVLRGKIEIEPGKVAPKLSKDYAARLPGHMKSIQTLTENIGTDGTLEYPFLYDLDPPNKKFVKGFIDRLIIKGDKAFLIDYKTTKKGPYRETAQSIVHDLQLRCYARVVQREFGIAAENIKAALYYVEGGDLIGTRFNDESLLRAESELLQCYNDIQESDPDNVWGSTGPHCNRCEYKTMCPFFKNMNNRCVEWDGDVSTL